VRITAFELLEKAGVSVAPGVDFGQAGKRAVRFSYASSEENTRGTTRGIVVVGCWKS
jgi:aspartate/methionine/tyrosine aminotransferase